MSSCVQSTDSNLQLRMLDAALLGKGSSRIAHGVAMSLAMLCENEQPPAVRQVLNCAGHASNEHHPSPMLYTMMPHSFPWH